MDNRSDMDMGYREQDLVAVARRERNGKRGYLVVNRLQGKHVPVRPEGALSLFGELGELLRKEYEGERLLLIGFAETATAIGAAVAAGLGALYMQTTREQIEGVDYFYFSELHSHATEQKLVREDLDRAVPLVDRIVFVEDEITTGNTIWNIIKLLEQAYPGRLAYSAASLLNGMDKEHLGEYEERGIRLHWLLKTCHEDYERRAREVRGDGDYHLCDVKRPAQGFMEYRIHGYQNARRLTDGQGYRESCRRMAEEMRRIVPSGQGQRILVVGTEEFMYPALIAAEGLEREGGEVLCHSTTRSPIVVSREEDYPLGERYELKSLYDARRTTYLYEIGTYDEVAVVTDAASEEREGLYSLINALGSRGNKKIHVIRWCER